jgi:hypothetical protein
LGGTTGKGVRLIEITDGLSNTFLAGEKHVPQDQFGNGGWDNCLYNGEHYTSSTRPAGTNYPLATDRKEVNWVFGSYHRAVCQFVFADGSVRGLFHTTNPTVLGYLACRNDGQVLPPLD